MIRINRCLSKYLTCKNSHRSLLIRSQSTQQPPKEQQNVTPQQEQPSSSTSSSNYQSSYGTQTIFLTKNQKYLIKWFGRETYKSVDDVPNQIPASTLTYVKDKARAKTSLVLILFTVVGAWVASLIGKRHRDAGHRRTDDTMNERIAYSKTHQQLAAHKYKDSD